MLETSGWTPWPGGSLVSGNITGTGSIGANATGSVQAWAPGTPATGLTVAAVPTLIECDGWDAIQVMGAFTGTGILFDRFDCGVIFAFFERAGRSVPPNASGEYMARLNPVTTAILTNTGLSAVIGSGCTFLPAGYISLQDWSQTGDYTAVYPIDNVARATTMSATGRLQFAHPATVVAGTVATSSHSVLMPLFGAARAAYKIGPLCAVTGVSSNITGLAVRLAYRLLRTVTGNNDRKFA